MPTGRRPAQTLRPGPAPWRAWQDARSCGRRCSCGARPSTRRASFPAGQPSAPLRQQRHRPRRWSISAFLTKVRMRLTRALLISARRLLRRMRFSAWGVLAMIVLEIECGCCRVSRQQAGRRRVTPAPEAEPHSRRGGFGQLSLAMSAKEARTAGLDDALHRVAAAGAGIALLAIDLEALLEIAQRAIGRRMVTQG